MPLVLRNEKGTPLTNAEVDGNFVFLEEGVDAAGQAAGSAQGTADDAAQAAATASEDLTVHKTSSDHDDRYLRGDVAESAPLLTDIPQSGVDDLPFALDALRTATQRAIYGDGPYPSLDFQFVGAKLLDPNTSFARASTATYFDETGILRTAAVNEPVIEYDPATGECLGLRTEAQATNALPYSNQMLSGWSEVTTGAPTSSLRGIVLNAAIAPDGTMTATKFVSSPALVSQRAYKSQGAVAPWTATDTWSFYAKAAEITRVGIRTSAGLGVGVANLLTGELTVNSSQCKIQDCGNGWYRLSGVFDLASNNVIWVYLADDSNNGTFMGDGSSGVYLWGGQTSVGPVVTSLIPTEETQVTRAVDVVTHPLNASSFNPNEGTLYFDRGEAPYDVAGFTISMGTLGTAPPKYLGLDYSHSGSTYLQTFSPSSAIGTLPPAYDRSSPHKFAVSWKIISDTEVLRTVVIDGVLSVSSVVTGDTTTIAAWDRIRIGGAVYSSSIAAITRLHSHQVSLYKRALSTAELIALTS